jgi:hypothetical protein
MPGALATAFDAFEAAGREVRAMVEATPRFQEHPEHRAQAYVSLAEAQAMAYNLVIWPRLDHPPILSHSSWHSTIYSLGQNCPDFRYGGALFDGRASYRLQGRVGALKLLLIQIQSPTMGHPDSREIGNYDLCELAGADGAFDVPVSAEADGTTGIRIEPDAPLNFGLIRRILGSIADDPGELRLVRVDGPPLPAETDEAAIAERVHAAAGMLRFIVGDWVIGLYDLYIKAAGGKNRFAHIAGGELATNVVGSPSTTYGLSVYEIAPDEAVLVEWEPPDSAYWSFQVGDVWSNAMDFFNYQTDLNMHTMRVDSDGRIRAVVSHDDPGIANWMDTRGRGEGTVVMRNYRARGESSAPTMRVVKAAELPGLLPDGTARVSSAERAAALAARQVMFRTAYGD